MWLFLNGCCLTCVRRLCSAETSLLNLVWLESFTSTFCSSIDNVVKSQWEASGFHQDFTGWFLTGRRTDYQHNLLVATRAERNMGYNDATIENSTTAKSVFSGRETWEVVHWNHAHFSVVPIVTELRDPCKGHGWDCQRRDDTRDTRFQTGYLCIF